MRRALMLGLVAILVAGCRSGGDPGAEPAAEAGFPVRIDTPAGTVTVPARPERVVSLSPTATETLFALGAGERVVAVDDQSTFPADAPRTDLSGLTPNVEAIAALEPDLVVIGFDPGDLRSSLEALDVVVLLQPAATNLDEAYDQIRQLGAATGTGAEAEELVTGLTGEIEAIVAATPRPDRPLTYFYELDPSLFSATSRTFIGRVLGLFGLENIADPADEEGFGYPKLSAEYVIDRDPDLVFLADTVCCDQSAATLAQRPGWAELRAVRSGGVVELDDDVASRWGPRIVELVRSVAGAVAAVLEPAT